METHAKSGFIVVNRQLQTSPQLTPNKTKDDSEVTERTTAKPVRARRRNKKKFHSVLARSRKRHTRFPEKNLAGKPDFASPEDKSIDTVPGFPDSDNSVCAKEL